MKRNSVRYKITASIVFLAILAVKNSMAENLSSSEINGIHVELSSPTIVVPMFSGEFRSREVEIRPEESEIAFQLKSLLRRKQFETALAQLNAYNGGRYSLALQLLKAQIYFQMAQYDSAEQAYQALLSKMPDLVRAHYDLGQLYMITENYAAARKHFAKTVSLGKNDALVHGQLGYLNLRLHNAWSAINAYQAALVLEPESMQWKQGLLAAFSQSNMQENALTLVDEMLQQDQRSQSLWLHRANILAQMGESRKSIASLETAARLGDLRHSQMMALAKLHLQEGNYQRAIEITKREMLSNTLPIESMDKILDWLHYESKWEYGLELIDKLEENYANYDTNQISTILLHKARFLEKQGVDESTVSRLFEKAVELNPVNGKAIMAYANYCRTIKNYTKSELLYSRAETFSEYVRPATKGKVNVYIAQKDYDQALTLLKRYYQRYPDELDVKQMIQQLEKVQFTQHAAST